MKKQRKSSRGKAKVALQPAAPAPKSPDRRKVLGLAKIAAIGVPVLGIGGFFSARALQASICELDLTKIGNGLPSVVQIHDPQCTMCQTLQRQTRRALRAYDDDRFQYLVANINTAEGNTLAGHYGVPNVTLLLFDGAGNMVDTVRGPIDADLLEAALDRHMAAHS